MKNKKLILPSLLFLTILLTSCHNRSIKNLLYIDIQKPSTTPQKFAPNFISKEIESEYGSIFSKDGKEFYYAIDKNKKSSIRYTKLENGKWLEPKTIITHEKYSFNDPFLSNDEKELYYISDLPRNEQDTITDFDIWYSKKEDNKWSEPINAGEKINTDKNEFYISFNSSGTMYFASNKNKEIKRKHDFDIYRSERIDGVFQEPIILSDSINTNRYEADVFIAPDESYIIFCSVKRSGFGVGDLYISFKEEKGNWTKAKNMGNEINTELHEICPFVTKDGKYFFFTRSGDIYWVDAKMILSYKEE